MTEVDTESPLALKNTPVCGLRHPQEYWAETQCEDGSWTRPTRPAGEVTGWVVCCDCYRTASFGAPSSWIGPVFTRVPSKTLEDLAVRRVFAADDEVAYVSERDDVHGAAVGLWRSQHALGVDALAEVEAAAAAASQARLRLDAAVALARHSGISWANIGRAAGMTRQSAGWGCCLAVS